MAGSGWGCAWDIDWGVGHCTFFGAGHPGVNHSGNPASANTAEEMDRNWCAFCPGHHGSDHALFG